MRSVLVLATVVVLLIGMIIPPGSAQNRRGPVIDMHLHAQKLDAFIANQSDKRWFPTGLRRPGSDEDLMKESLAALARNNVVRAVTSDELANVERWWQAA